MIIGNLKSFYDRRQNDLINFIVKYSQKTFELFQKPFEYLYNAEYLAPQVKAELRQAAVADGLIGGNISDYQPPSSSSTTSKNTYG